MSANPPDMELHGDDWEQLLAPDAGDEIFAFAARIFPICRSITGDGVRQTLREIGSHVALDVSEVPTGTEVFDWTIPREWNIRDAYIRNGAGEKIIDFAQSNLHVMSYSVPVQKRTETVWYIGEQTRCRSAASNCHTAASSSNTSLAVASSQIPVVTPFGRPVVPEV